ncbi:hypothetical protein D3C72_2020240 [compost metagenome]
MALEICGNQAYKISAPAIASIGITNTQNHQYNHPMVNPAQGPMALRAYVENEPVSGCATAISPSMRMTRKTKILVII